MNQAHAASLRIQAPPPAVVQNAITLTIWPDERGTRKTDRTMPWSELPDLLRKAPHRQAKMACPLIKLATFGNQTTDKGSLRHDANMLEVTGIEGDYDAGEISIQEARIRLENHRLRALLYPSFSSTPDKPRWRVLAPLSKPAALSERLRYAEALNGALGGILAPESGKMSQSFFYGWPVGADPQVLITLDDPEDGICLDDWDHLDEFRQPFAGKVAVDGTPRAPSDYLAELLQGDDIHGNALRVVGRMVAGGVSDDIIRPLFAILAIEVAKSRGPERAKALMGGELDRMIQGARRQGYAPPPAVDCSAILLKPGGAAAPVAIDPDTDWLSEPPKATAAMFYGLVGDIAKAGAKGREVSPVSVALAFISYLSAQVGRDLYIPIGDARHPLHLFTLHVGRTAMGGKGESVAITTRIDAAIRADEVVVEDQNLSVFLLGQVHTGGLSTREGLTWFVHDGFTQGKDEIPAIEDKRLWVFEPEFVNVLAQGKREGNTLSSALRDVWDGGSIKPATKSSRIWATEPHIGLHGCITPGELLHSLENKEITNGFANRFLICWAERTCLIPDPQPTPLDVITTLAARLREVITWATGTYPLTKYNRAMIFTPQAEALWHQSYARLKSRDTTSNTITAMLERRAPITRRLAALFAATDMTTQVDVHHLEAAIAWANYHRDSVEFIFGADAKERQTASEATENRRKITDYLTGREWVLRSELYSKALSKRADAKELDIALQGLLADNRIEKRTEGRGGSAPNTKTLYRIIL